MSKTRHRHPQLWRDVCSVTGLMGIVKCAGALKLFVSARYFGAGDQLDAFLLAFLIPSFLADLLAGSLVSVLLPALIESKESHPQKAAQSYAAVLYQSTCLLGILALVMGLLSAPMLTVVASSFGPEKVQLARQLLLMMLPILPLSAMSNTWRSVLNSENRFRLAALAPIATPLLTIGLLYCRPGASVKLLAAATTFGSMLEVIWIGIGLRFLHQPLFPPWCPHVRLFGQLHKQYAAMLGGALVMSVGNLFNQLLAARFGSGSVAVYNLGTRLLTVFLAVGPAALGTVMQPQLSRVASGLIAQSFRTIVRRYLFFAMSAALPISAFVFLFSPSIVHAVFHGKQLSRDAAGQIATIQAISFLQLPFTIGLAILIRVLASIKSNETLFRLSLISLIPTALLACMLSNAYGVPGIVFATACAQALSFLLWAHAGFRRIRELEANDCRVKSTRSAETAALLREERFAS